MIKVLAIDTTGTVASVAVANENNTIAEFTINYKLTHSQTIMPMIEYMAKMLELDLNTIDYIACSNGPGSFTGLRIGAATAKGLAHGLNKKIIAVPTLDALAYNVIETDKIIVPMIDAKRNQIYTAFYSCSNGELERISDYIADDINSIIETIESNDIDAVFLGDGAIVYKDIIKSFNTDYLFAFANNNLQRAASVAALAINYAKKGKIVDYNNFNIMYLRKSQAEREYDERCSK